MPYLKANLHPNRKIQCVELLFEFPKGNVITNSEIQIGLCLLKRLKFFNCLRFFKSDLYFIFYQWLLYFLKSRIYNACNCFLLGLGPLKLFLKDSPEFLKKTVCSSLGKQKNETHRQWSVFVFLCGAWMLNGLVIWLPSLKFKVLLLLYVSK